MSDPEREYCGSLEEEILSALGKFNALASSQDEIHAVDTDEIAAWLLANRWHFFPDEMKTEIIHCALRRELCGSLWSWNHYNPALQKE